MKSKGLDYFILYSNRISSLPCYRINRCYQAEKIDKDMAQAHLKGDLTNFEVELLKQELSRTLRECEQNPPSRGRLKSMAKGKGRGWWGNPRLHSKASKKGWRNRRRRKK